MNAVVIKSWLAQCQSVALATIACFLAGCSPELTEYIVELQPRGNIIERTLVFYREGGVNTNAVNTNAVSTTTNTTKYLPFEPGALARITALYPAHSLSNAGNRYVIRGEFTNELPKDVGGAGTYYRLPTRLGEAGFYVERFRGNDDLVGMAEQRYQAADQLADIIVGWSQMELGPQPGYDKLREFLNVNLRRDLKNLGEYTFLSSIAAGYKTNANEEFYVRSGQYLFERGYFTLGEIPGLFRDASADNSRALLPWIQRLVARKMGVPESEPVPPSLAFLTDVTMLGKSLDKYLASTELYRGKLKQWEAEKKLKPDTEKPEPLEVAVEALGNLVQFDLFGWHDQIGVRLSLATPPVHSNGRWDETLKQVIWETTGLDSSAGPLPFSCYALWVQADEEYQKKHFGKVALTGDHLAQYCLWRSSLDGQQGDEWDALLSGLQPGAGLTDRLDSFRFSGESDQAGTTNQQTFPSTSYPCELLKAALGM